MGLLERCYQTYEKNKAQVGKPSTSLRTGWEAPVLLPVAHTTQKINIEVSLAANGTFRTAGVVLATDMTTVIPCTEGSSARTSGAVPHPLVDKLQYIAGDYAARGGKKKPMWTEYPDQLRAWCDSPFGLDNVRAVLRYLEKGTPIADLVACGALVAVADGTLLSKQGSRLVDNLVDWHSAFGWELRYRKWQTRENGKTQAVPLVFTGAPAPADIAQAAYGAKVDEKLKQQTIERLLPCITEGRQFPKDLMLAAVRRAANGIALEPWEAAKTRSIACALVKGYHHRNMEEEHTMALEESCNDRSYLFGRILACAEQAEQNANYLSGEHSGRPTNALRYEVAYTQHPARTLALLRKQLEPYLERLLKAGKSTYANDLMLRLIARIPAEQFNDQPLTELYLLGYACQRTEFFKAKDAKEAKDATPTADE